MNVVDRPLQQGALDRAQQIRADERNGLEARADYLTELLADQEDVRIPGTDLTNSFRMADLLSKYGSSYGELATEVDNFSPNLLVTTVYEGKTFRENGTADLLESLGDDDQEGLDDRPTHVDTIANAGFGSSFPTQKSGVALYLVHNTLSYSPDGLVTHYRRFDFPDEQHHFVGATVVSDSEEGLGVSIRRHPNLNIESLLTMSRDDVMSVAASEEDSYYARGNSTAGLVYTGVATGANALLGGPVPALIGFGVTGGQFLLNGAFDVTTNRAIRYDTSNEFSESPTLIDIMELDADHYARMGTPITNLYAIQTREGATVLLYGHVDPRKSSSTVKPGQDDPFSISLNERGPEVLVLPLIGSYESSSSSSNGGPNPDGGLTGGPGNGGLGGGQP